MKIICLFLRPIALILLDKEWKGLKRNLLMEHRTYLGSSPESHLFAQMLLVSGEDHRFFSHLGFDWVAIGRAIWKTIFLGIREGGSTIEQQIVRVLTDRFELTLARKIREILLATLVSTVVPKRDLPGLYLQIGYYGWRMNGIHNACRRLRIDSKFISLSASAGLVARLKYPQPQKFVAARMMQIQRRKAHLLQLHDKHSISKVYRGFREAQQDESVPDFISRNPIKVPIPSC